MYLVVYIAYKEKWPDIELYSDSWVLAMVSFDGQRLERNMIRKLLIIKSEEEAYGYTSIIVQKM